MAIYSSEDILQNVYDHDERAIRTTEEGSGGTVITLVDESSSTVTYVGKAVAGSSTSSSVWSIQKISVSGTVTTISWADGNNDYDNKWSDRETLTYS